MTNEDKNSVPISQLSVTSRDSADFIGAGLVEGIPDGGESVLGAHGWSTAVGGNGTVHQLVGEATNKVAGTDNWFI